MSLTGEVFCLTQEGDEGVVLYAPLRGLLLRTNQDFVDLASNPTEGTGAGLPERLEELLREHRFFEPDPVIQPRDECDLATNPRQLCIFPTSACNLRCVYCYADAGTKPRFIDLEVARAAVDYALQSVVESGLSVFSMGFHGGGEPALAWKPLVGAVEYAQTATEAAGLKLSVHCATNGVLTRRQAAWMTAHLDSLTVSLDGPPDIHDRQRMFPDGRGSYHRVAATLHRLEDADCRYALRATITPESVSRMTDIVEHFHANFGATMYQFEPLFECGRCRTTGWSAPPPDQYVQHFKQAYQRAQELGVRLTFSGARFDAITDGFCGAVGGNFCVTPEGYVTSCYEVSSPDDGRAETFLYGRYDPVAKAFSLDHDRLKHLRRYRIQNLEWCANCFCRWHCAGDCLAKVMAAKRVGRGSPRCEMIRELTRFQLLRLLPASSEGGEHACLVRSILGRRTTAPVPADDR